MKFLRPVLLTLFSICVLSTLHGQVTADFTYSATFGCGSLQVSFCDNSVSTSGNIVSWSWDMGGAPSTLECPGRVFGIPGVYTVCLTVTDDSGASDTQCLTDLITVYNLPEPDFIATPVEGCAPAEISFTDLSTSQDGAIQSWLWGLGGSCGTIFTTSPGVPAAVCTYDIPDDYTISLTVIDVNGCVNTKTKTDYLIVSPAPEALFSTIDTFSCSPPYTSTFTNNSPITSGINFQWDFGPGNGTYNGVNPPPVSFNASGSHTVTLIATSTNSNCSDTFSIQNVVEVGYGVDFDFTPDSGCEDVVVSFTDLSSEPADSVVWDFGDGNFSNDPNPTYQYSNPGCYYVKLSREIAGCWSERFSSTCINVETPPAATYNNDNNVGCTLPHVVNFAGTSFDAVSWEWDFGDGTSSTLQNPTHVYGSFGDYPITLTVRNANGCENSVTINTIEVQPVQAQLVDDQIEGCAPMTITLGENSSSVTSIVSWSWQMVTTSSTYISSSPSPTFTINDIGVFDVQLTVTNTLGCTDTQVFTGAVSVGSIPNLAFTATPVESCVEQPITFTDLSDATVDFWYWDFGDGNDSDQTDPVHFYMDTGYYDVNLIASHNGCINSITYSDYIHITAPVSKYSIIKFCDNTFQRKFKNNAVGADSIFWDFGVLGIDTDTSMQANPEFIYPDTGYYYVTQTVFNSTTGCQHSKTEEIYITDPKANFLLSSNQGCLPMTISLIDNSSFAESYTWSSPSGVISDPNTSDPTIYFDTPGIHSDIQLIIKDENNCRDTFLLTEQIFVNEIIPNINASPSSGCPTLNVSFNDASSNLFATNTTWDWTFGNNLGTSNIENPAFSFPDIGNYDIDLTVTDDWGCTTTVTFDNAVQVSSATAFFDADNIGCTSAGISFNNFSDGDGLAYSWDFGDGSPLSTEESPSHFYLNEGTFTVCLTITDISSCVSTMCLDNYIEITDPVAGYTLDNNFASCPPLTVNFQNLSLNATDYLWDFGDGSGLSNLPNPTHVYTIPGSFEVMLIASNSPDCHDTLIFDNLVVLDGPVGEFSYSIDSTCAPAEITFMANSVANYQYTWDFGNGDVSTNPNYILSDTFTYIYNEPGVYTPTLSLENTTGCFRTLPEIGSIYVSTLNSEFLATDTLLCDDNVPITFYNFSNSVDDLTTVDWIFQGGNPTNSSNFEEVVSFNGSGSFDVTMIVSNGFCKDTLFKEDYVNIGPKPEADFQISVLQGCEPLQVSFTDQSTISSGIIDEWDWDFADGNGSGQTNPNHAFSAGMNTPVTLIVSSQEGCTDTLVQTIDVFEATAVSLIENQSICIGEVANLQAQILGDTTGVSYFWSPSTGLSCTDCLNPIATPADTTTYTFSLTNAGGCVTTSEVTVVVRPYTIPDVQITPDTTICANSIIQLYANGGSDVYSYNWDSSQPGLSCYESCFNPIAEPSDTTTYVVTVTNQYGCSNQGSVTVNILDESQPFVGEDKTICEGGSVQLNTTMGNNPIWLVSDGLNCTNCPDPIASPDMQTTYYVQVTTDNGCEIFDTLVVNIMTADDIDAGENIAICRGETIELNGVGEGTVIWTPNTNMINPDSFNPEVTPTSSTTYFMIITNGDCTLRDSVRVEVTDKTDIDLEDVTICEGEETELFVDGRADTYNWSPSPDLSSLTIENPIASPSSTTTFTVIASLATCEPDTESVVVNVLPAPIISMSSNIDYFPGQEVELDVSVDGQGIYEYNWSPNTGISCITCSNPIVTPEGSETYIVIVTDIDTGCSSEKSVQFNILDKCPEELITVPNIFTPNGDGVNDRIEIFLSSTLNNEIYSYRIFNRWGSLVFETNDNREGWDGTFRGRNLPDGVYIYVVEAPCNIEGGGRIIKKGDFLLLR
jgi:gliding motility-associated-like protein